MYGFTAKSSIAALLIYIFKSFQVDLGNDKEAVKDNSGLLCIQGGSIDDYFKAKMEALKAKRK